MTRHFQHSTQIWRDFPELVPGVLFVEGVTATASVASHVADLTAVAASRLARTPEGEFPEVRAWRRAFARMGLKPTQYRCASESLLRRFRKEGPLPRVHPLVDLCNAASLRFAIPVAAFDVDRIDGDLEVRYARRRRDLPDLRRTGGAARPRPGELRRQHGQRTRPQVDQPAERRLSRTAGDDHRVDRRRGDARLGHIRRPRARCRARRCAQGHLVRHAGDRDAARAIAALHVRATGCGGVSAGWPVVVGLTVPEESATISL